MGGNHNSGRRTAAPAWRTQYRRRDFIARVRAATVRGVPVMPHDLGPEGQSLWRDIVEKLDRAAVLSKTDGPAIESCCRLWSLHLRTLRLCGDCPANKHAADVLVLYTKCLGAWLSRLGLPLDRQSPWDDAAGQEKDSLDDFLASRPF